jgi:hypothetical protein
MRTYRTLVEDCRVTRDRLLHARIGGQGLGSVVESFRWSLTGRRTLTGPADPS